MLELIDVDLGALHASASEKVFKELFELGPLQEPIIIVIILFPNSTDHSVQIGSGNCQFNFWLAILIFFACVRTFYEDGVYVEVKLLKDIATIPLKWQLFQEYVDADGEDEVFHKVFAIPFHQFRDISPEMTSFKCFEGDVKDPNRNYHQYKRD